MKIFKLLDTWVQFIIFILAIVFFFGKELGYSFIDDGLYEFIIIYCFVGFFQLCSIILHHITATFQCQPRKAYQYISYIIISIMLLSFIIPPLLLVYWVMIYTAPFMAGFYVILCFMEYKQIKKLK